MTLDGAFYFCGEGVSKTPVGRLSAIVAHDYFLRERAFAGGPVQAHPFRGEMSVA